MSTIKDDTTPSKGTTPNNRPPIMPEWKRMPKPKALLTVSWEDVYLTARNLTRARFGRDPRRKEIRFVFDEIGYANFSPESSTLWSFIEYHVGEYYGSVEK